MIHFHFPRRRFLSWIPAGLCAAVFGKAQAQNTQEPPNDDQILNPRRAMPVMGPYQTIESSASTMKPGDLGSIRAVVDAIFAFPRQYRMPDVMAAIVKQRLIDAQVAYFDGKTSGTVDAAVVDAINTLATTFDTPDYASVSLLQVQYMRNLLATGMPTLFKPVTPDIKVGEPNVPMSPLQAIFVMSLLIDQKMQNPDYQKPPAEWDRDIYPKLMLQDEARLELVRRIKAGEVPKGEPQYRVIVGPPFDGSLFFQLRRRIAAMSVADGLKLFNETFARLGIQ
jgi:hypothetical protein